MSSRSALVAAFAFVCVILTAREAGAQPRIELEKARAAYVGHNFAEAEVRLRGLLDPKAGLSDPVIVSLARMYLAAVLITEARKAEATPIFEKLILEDPSFDPDPLVFQSDVIDAFIDVRAQLRERLRAQAQAQAKIEEERRAKEKALREAQERWLQQVKDMAQEDRTTVRHSRLVACLPFGAGQFQNNQPVLGWILLGGEAALFVASGVLVPMAYYARERRDEVAAEFDYPRADLYNQRAHSLEYANLGLAGGFVALALGGIVQANIAYSPESVEKKKRDLPPTPTAAKLTPIVAPSSNGVFLGVSVAAF